MWCGGASGSGGSGVDARARAIGGAPCNAKLLQVLTHLDRLPPARKLGGVLHGRPRPEGPEPSHTPRAGARAGRALCVSLLRTTTRSFRPAVLAAIVVIKGDRRGWFVVGVGVSVCGRCEVWLRAR